MRPDDEAPIAEQGTTRTPGTPSFDAVAVGDELPVRHAHLSRGDVVNYSGVAGDANPIHWDENLAKVAGLPDVIAHGMLTMGLGAGFVSAWSGDPGAVTRYAVRLSAPAVVPPSRAQTSSSAAGSSHWIRKRAPESSSSARSRRAEDFRSRDLERPLQLGSVHAIDG